MDHVISMDQSLSTKVERTSADETSKHHDQSVVHTDTVYDEVSTTKLYFIFFY